MSYTKNILTLIYLASPLTIEVWSSSSISPTFQAIFKTIVDFLQFGGKSCN